MRLPLLIFYVLLFFAIQLILCFKAKKKLFKAIPLFVIILIFIFSLLFYFGIIGGDSMSSALAALICTIICVCSALGIILAWLLYAFFPRKK